jgi:hypothetical protein
VPGTLLNETQARYSIATLGELKLVEKKINGGNPAVSGNDEISTSVCWRLTRAARYPLDPPAIAHFFRFGYWLIPKVRVSSLDHARDLIDLVAASVDTSVSDAAGESGRQLQCSRSGSLHQHGGALANFLKRHFEATKLLGTQFSEHSPHLPGMLSKG